MKVIYNNILPPFGFIDVNLFGVIFVNNKLKEYFDDTSRQHAMIHTAQMKELLYVGFYILYFLEWIWQIIIPPRGAYRHISFEREAYSHESDPDYLYNRKHFAQWRK